MLGDADWWARAAVPALSAVGTSAILTAALQAFFKYRADDRIERLKAQLGRDNSAELARVTSELSRESARDLERIRGEATRDFESFKQRFALLTARQAEAAIALAEKLATLDTAARRLLMPGSPSNLYEQLYTTCENARFEAQEFIDAKRLLFRSDVGDLADKIIKRVAMGESTKHVAVLSNPLAPEMRDAMRDAWAEQVGPGTKDLAEMTDKLRDLLSGATA